MPTFFGVIYFLAKSFAPENASLSSIFFLVVFFRAFASSLLRTLSSKSLAFNTNSSSKSWFSLTTFSTFTDALKFLGNIGFPCIIFLLWLLKYFKALSVWITAVAYLPVAFFVSSICLASLKTLSISFVERLPKLTPR